MLDKLLFEVLVDPVDRGELYYLEARAMLFNPRTNAAYVVRDGIAVLLPTEARVLEGTELSEVTAELGNAVRTGTSTG